MPTCAIVGRKPADLAGFGDRAPIGIARAQQPSMQPGKNVETMYAALPREGEWLWTVALCFVLIALGACSAESDEGDRLGPDGGTAEQPSTDSPGSQERSKYSCGVFWTCVGADGEMFSAAVPAHVCASDAELAELEAVEDPCEHFIGDDCVEVVECSAGCEPMEPAEECSCPYGGPCTGSGAPLEL